MGRGMQKTRVKTVAKSDAIPQALLDICEDLKSMEESNNAQNINYKYQLGERFIQVSENPDTFGKKGVQQMMEILGIPRKRDVDRAMLFAATYTAKQVEVYIHRYDNVNWAKNVISWSHWDKLLVGYLSEKEREEWMDATVRNGWTSTELAKQLVERYEKGSRHGRGVKKPGTKKDLLDKMNKPLTVFRNFYAKVWADKDNPASVQLTHDLADVDEETVTYLGNLVESIDSSIDYLQSMRKELEQMKLDTLWAKQLRAAAKAKEEVAEAADDDTASFVDSLL